MTTDHPLLSSLVPSYLLRDESRVLLDKVFPQRSEGKVHFQPIVSEFIKILPHLDYRTSKASEPAPNHFVPATLLIVHDALEGRREIPLGAGEVKVCVGFLKRRDEYGMRREIPLYQTRTF